MDHTQSHFFGGKQLHHFQIEAAAAAHSVFDNLYPCLIHNRIGKKLDRLIKLFKLFMFDSRA
jgi:hypothetical protein